MATRLGGRPRQVEFADIVREGRAIGLHDLSIAAVAERLGVSTTALYRHVENRWDLERHVGESILSDLTLADDPRHDTAEHLTAMCLQLYAFILDHPGLARYVQTLFPRGEGGRRLLAAGTAALVRRGYADDAAMVLCSACASLSIGYASSVEAQRERDGLEEQRHHSEAALSSDPALGSAHANLPHVTDDEYVRMWLGCAIRAFVAAVPPGRSVAQIREVLGAAVPNATASDLSNSDTDSHHPTQGRSDGQARLQRRHDARLWCARP